MNALDTHLNAISRRSFLGLGCAKGLAQGRKLTISKHPNPLKSRSLFVTIRFTPAWRKVAASKVSNSRFRPSR